jgi:hypothetical protein
MRLLSLCALLVFLWPLGCGKPDAEACRRACSHVVSLTAKTISGVDDAKAQTLAAQAEAHLADCVQACQQSDSSYVACLEAARSVKEVSECNRP